MPAAGDDRDPAYHAFLLRLWRAGAAGPWHASLHGAEGATRHGFADLEGLFAYLRRLTAPTPGAGPPGDAGGGDDPAGGAGP